MLRMFSSAMVCSCTLRGGTAPESAISFYLPPAAFDPVSSVVAIHPSYLQPCPFMAGIKGFLMPGHLGACLQGLFRHPCLSLVSCLVHLTWSSLGRAGKPVLETSSLWLFVGKGTWVPSMGEPVGWGQGFQIGDREAAEISELTWIQRRPCATILGSLVMVSCCIVCGSCRD